MKSHFLLDRVLVVLEFGFLEIYIRINDAKVDLIGVPKMYVYILISAT